MKQNRLVSRLPFFVFNCQGSRHHPAGHADKVLLAENHRHRVYGVGLRPGGHLRQVLRPNTGKALRNAQRPVHAVNGVNKYPGLLRPAPCRAAHPPAPPEACRPHFLLGLPLKGFYLCLGILTTRKRVYKFLYANLAGYFVLIMYHKLRKLENA